MIALPAMPALPDDRRATGQLHLRYEDVAQDGRVLLPALTQGLGLLWRRMLAEKALSAALRADGIVPILARMTLLGGDEPVAWHQPLDVEGGFHLAHTADARGRVERLVLGMWMTVEGHRGRAHGPAPEGAGERVVVGAVYAEDVFTRPFGPPERRRVTALPLPEGDFVPPDRWPWRPPEAVGAVPADATALHDPATDLAPVVFGLAHTDTNQHVNSLVYPRVFEEAALRRCAAIGRDPAGLLARACEVGWRKPFFAGDRAKIELQAYDRAGRVGVVGAFVPADAPDPKGHCWLRMEF